MKAPSQIAICISWFIIFSGALFAADTNRGVELFGQGKFAEAQTELQQVIEQNPDDARARRFLGWALLEQHKASEAAPHVRKADELESNGETKLALARLAVEEKDFDKADALLGESSGEYLEYVRGMVALNRKKYDDAARDFESFLAKKSDHAYAHYYAGLAYNGAKKPDKMLSHFEIFLKLKPDAPEARKVRAVIRSGG